MKCPQCDTFNSEDSQFCKKCATSLTGDGIVQPSITKTIETPKEELTTGSSFAGRYQIIEELGKGGMGKVYKAVDTKINEKIALKLIKPEIASDKKIIERFSNELKMARKIVHRNVGRMFELMEDAGTHFITMEYVSGQDLKGLIRQSAPLSVARTVSIAKQICEGLTEAHRMGIVHRDLKPSNIMIDKDGDARIMDFGIARSLRGKGITGAGVIIGTPEYMSPEQVDGKEADRRSDIYSLGVILYEMLTGRLPFEGDTPLSIAVQHRSDAPRDPKELNAQIPDELCQVILKCMAKENNERYQAVKELSAVFDRIKQGIPSTKIEKPRQKSTSSKEITVSFSAKRIFLPAIVALAIAILGLLLWHPWSYEQAPASTLDEPSVAVLPFEDLSPQQDQEYLCLGIAGELINRLNKIPKLWVPARASSFSFRGSEANIQEVGNRLNVDSVLMGTLQKADSRLRITVELVKIPDGHTIWSKKYERSEEDIFALQDEISLSIVENLKIELLGEEKSEFVTQYTKHPEAYNLFLKGIYFWNKRTEEDLRKAIDCLEQVIELDPDFAMAYARLADAYGLLPYQTAVPAGEAASKARAAVMKALDLDETLAEAHSALGFIRMYYDWDWEAAEAEFKRAVQTKPNYVTAHHWYAEYLTWMGRHEEAIAEITRAQELDPLSPLINYVKAYILFYARQYERSLEQCRQTLELDPNFTLAYYGIGKCYIQKGKYDEAIVELQNADRRTYLGLAYGLAGKRKEALGIIKEMEEQWRQGNGRAFPIISVYVGLGEQDLALDWLEKSFEIREPRMAQIKVDPVFDNLRSNPRFKALLKKMNL